MSKYSTEELVRLLGRERGTENFFRMSSEQFDTIIARLLAANKLCEADKKLLNACSTLMDEVFGKKATDWGIVNEAMVEGTKAIAEYEGKP